MAYAKLAGKLLKPAFKHGIRLIRNRSVQQGIFKPGRKSKLAKDLASRTIKTGKIGRLRMSKDLKNVYGTETNMKKALFNYATTNKTPQGVPTFRGFAGRAHKQAFNPKLNKYTARKAEAATRGGLSEIESWKDIKIHKTLDDVKGQHNVRTIRRKRQTPTNIGEFGKGYQTMKGHHNLPINLGDDITKKMKMDPEEIPDFWNKVNAKYKNIASGDHWANMRLLPEGKEYKHLVGELDISPHDQAHAMLNRIGITPEKLVKMFKGKTKEEGIELIGKLDHKFKRMDQWIFKRMKKFKAGEDQLMENILAHSEIKRMWPNISKAERRIKIKEWLAERRLIDKEDTAKALKIFSKPLSQDALDTPMAGFFDKAGKQMTLGGN